MNDRLPSFASEFALGLLVGLLFAGASAAAPATSLADLDRDFVCPETMLSDEARMAALKDFFNAYGAAEPKATPGEVIQFRQALLEKHICAKTLASIHAAHAAVENGDVQRQAWLPISVTNGIELFVSTDHLAPVLDPRFPAERAVDAYARLTFSVSQTTNVTHIDYDEVVSHSVYYCSSDRYALVENDYFRSGSKVLSDPSPVAAKGPYGLKLFAVTPIPSGSMSAAAARWACSAAKGSPS